MTNVCAIKWTCLTITQHLYIFLLVSWTRYDQCLCCLMDMLNYYSTLVPWFHRQDMINVCAISWTCFIIPLLYIFPQKAVHLDPWRPTASQRGAVLIFLRKPMATYDFSGRADPWVQSLLEGGPRTPIAPGFNCISRGIRTSISKEICGHLWFSRGAIGFNSFLKGVFTSISKDFPGGGADPWVQCLLKGVRTSILKEPIATCDFPGRG